MEPASFPSTELGAGRGSSAQALSGTGIPTGKLGVWWFPASEIPVFGGLIASYIVVRLGSSGWSEAAAHLSVSLALVNTLVLLTSSMTMVMAFAAVERKDPKSLRTFLLLTILLGLGFLAIKAVEYTRELRAGFTPAAGLFWCFYYTLTGLHALHVLGGVVVNFVLLLTVVGRGQECQRWVEFAGL